MRVYGIIGQKGGVGKTTTTDTLAKLSGVRGMRKQDWAMMANGYVIADKQGALYTVPTLIVGLDGQRTITAFNDAMTGEHTPDKPLPIAGTIVSVLEGQQSIMDVARQIGDNLWIVPEHPLLHEWTYSEGGVQVLRKALRQPAVTRLFERVYIDFPPAMHDTSRVGMAACDVIVTPIRPDMFDLLTLLEQKQTLLQLQAEPEMPDIIVAGIFASAYDERTDRDSLEEGFGPDCPLPVLHDGSGEVLAVHYAKAVKDAHKAGQSVVTFAPESRAASEFRKLWRLLECQS